jgi:Tol biopolymer transport system component
MPAAVDPGGLFWAPDSAHIAFFEKQELKSLDVNDGMVTTIAQTPGATSGSWSLYGDILIDGPEGDGLFRVSAKDGNRTRITSPNRAIGERHYQPQFLPDGRHFVFLMRTNQPDTTGTYLASLDSREQTFLTQASGKAMISSSQIFFVRDGTLFRQELNMTPPRLVGERVRIADHVSSSGISGSAAFSVSPNGVLAYRSGSSFQNAKLQWFDRAGKQLNVTSEPAVYTQIALSPDEKYIAVERRDPDSGLYDIWLVDPIKNTNTRLTSDDSSQRNPVWLPDSQHLIFSSDKSGWELLKMRIGSTAKPELVLKQNERYRPLDVTANNTLVLRDEGRAFFTLVPGKAREPEIFFQTRFMKSGGRLSPDGKWLAFTSGDSARAEVYVMSFPGADQRLQISTNGGVQPLWNGDGTELFYLDPAGHVMSVTIQEKSGLVAAVPKVLFSIGLAPTSGLYQYAVNGKGTRFLAIPPAAQEQPTPIDVIVGWAARPRQNVYRSAN